MGDRYEKMELDKLQEEARSRDISIGRRNKAQLRVALRRWDEESAQGGARVSSGWKWAIGVGLAIILAIVGSTVFMGILVSSRIEAAVLAMGAPEIGAEVEIAAQQTLAAAPVQAATSTPQPTQALLPTHTPFPVVDPDEVFTGSLPNYCLILDTTQEDIDGEMLTHGGVIYQNAAIGAAECAVAFEGRWYEGFPPSDDHHLTAFFGAAENVSVYQGSQWLIPVGAMPRDIVHGLGLGKCDNWDDAQVGYLPIVLDYVDLASMEVIHQATSCEELRGGNPLPEEIGLIPGEALPHFNLGYTWGGVAGSQVIGAAYTGESRFDSTNRSLVCATADNPLLGNDAVGVAAIDPAWDPQCQYLLDGRLNGGRAVMLVRGEDITSLSGWKASVWFVNPNWVAFEWADRFALDNCPSELPVYFYDGTQWILDHTFGCP